MMTEELATSCPKCGQSEEKLIQYGAAFGAFCPGCKKVVIGTKKVHPDFLEYREPKHPKPKKRKPEEEEMKEEREEEVSRPPRSERGMFERPSPPEQVLRDVLESYDVKEPTIKFLERRSRLKGGIHPTELQDMLQGFTKTFIGIADKQVIPYIAEEYALALEEQDYKRRELSQRRPQFGLGMRGDRDLRPRDYGGPGLGYKRDEYQPEYERRSVWDSYQRRWVQPPPQDYSSPYYQPPYQPRGEELLTKEAVAEIVADAISKKAEEDKFDKLTDKVGDIETGLRDRIDDKFEEIKVLVEKDKEDEAGKDKPEAVTEEKIKEIIEGKGKDSYIKYLEESHKDTTAEIKAMRDEFKESRTDFKETLKDQRVEYDKKLEDARKGTVGSTDADVKREAIKVVKELGDSILTAAPIRRTIRDIRGGEPDQPPNREETTDGKSAADYADDEFVEDSDKQ